MKYIITSILIIISIVSCKNNMVDYEAFLEKPSAVRKNKTIEVELGYTVASGNWINTTYEIKNDKIYIYGTYVFKELPRNLTIAIPDQDKNYRVFWVDGDGTKTEIVVNQ